MKKKTELYTDERQIILNKIFEILDINEDNNTFFLRDLDNDEKKQNQILELEPDIRKYFACSSWSCFGNPNIKRKVLSIIKNITKKMNYDIISKRKQIKNNEKNYYDTIYYLIKQIKVFI
jgi:hypothetical protein